MGCHDKDAGTPCYADTSFLRACLRIISLPGLARLALERKGLLAYAESEKRFYFKSVVFLIQMAASVRHSSLKIMLLCKSCLWSAEHICPDQFHSCVLIQHQFLNQF